MIILAFIIHHIFLVQSMQAQNLTCFLAGADDSQFPLENIPFGIAARKQSAKDKFAATRIGDWVVNLKEAENNGLFSGALLTTVGSKVFQGEYLNDFMGLTRAHWKEARESIQQHFSANSPLKDNEVLKAKLLSKVEETVNYLPAKIGDYTDFYSSRSHAFNVGSIIRGPDNALNENWLQIPIGYHGRASSIVLSGTPLRRPRGQFKGKDDKFPVLTDCKRLDFQIEMGAFVGGQVNPLGSPIKVNDAWNNIFGFVLLNDWSFRDFQVWEYVPLGPFTAKNGMSTISPWIVTLEALQGCEVSLDKQEPTPLDYLNEKNHKSYDIELSLLYKTPNMQKHEQLVKTNYKYMYWSCAQQLCHHSITGCNMQVGDLLGSGTISGPEKHEFGSMLELNWGGKNDITIPGGETRKFAKDGDSININGVARRNGKLIGFGECEGTILPAFDETAYV